MFYKEDKNFINEVQKAYIQEVILNNTSESGGIGSGDFPWYFSPHAVYGDHSPFLYHAVIRRYENRKDGEGVFNSSMGPFFMKLLDQFAEKNDIKFETVYRCSVNITFPLLLEPTSHQDHEFPYNHFLIYLNDSDGDTCVYNEEGTKIEKRITPEQYKGVCFEKRFHYAELPTNGVRFVAVYTYI
jgi:hypothetical protein